MISNAALKILIAFGMPKDTALEKAEMEWFRLVSDPVISSREREAPGEKDYSMAIRRFGRPTHYRFRDELVPGIVAALTNEEREDLRARLLARPR